MAEKYILSFFNLGVFRLVFLNKISNIAH